MPAGDVTLTRGVGFRDDGLDASLWTAAQTANVSVLFGGDGDILSLTVTFFNAVSGNNGKATRSIASGPSTTTYPKVIIRHKDSGIGANADLTMTVGYSDATSSTFTLAKTGSYGPPETFSLTAGKTVNRLEVKIQANTSIIAASYTVDWDFIFIFKETLTLPAVSRPLQFSLPRTLVELPIPSREGGVLQDIGSDSARLEIAGTLVTTTSPNNYSGDQWWDVLVGTWLEGNWQWLGSDRVNYKYQIEELAVTQDPGKVGYYEFKLRLKKVDILSATAQTFGAIQ